MQAPNRPIDLEETAKQFEELRELHSDLVSNQRTYQEKITTVSNDRPYYSKSYKVELDHCKDYFHHNLEKNFINHYAKANFLQCTFQEPPVHITKQILSDTEARNDTLRKILKSHNTNIDKLKSAINDKAKLIQQDSAKSVDVEYALSDVLAMEAEISRIKKSSHPDMSVEQAMDILAQQSEDLAIMNKKVNAIRDDVDNSEWKVQKKRKARDALREKLAELSKLKETKIQSSIERNPQTEQDYKDYKKAIEMCKSIHGVESVEYENFSHARITFAQPYDAVLEIHINLHKDVITSAFLTNTRVKIHDILMVAKQTTANNGMRILIEQTVTRLKKESGRSLY